MVLTVTLSPRVEREITVSGFCPGGENQIQTSRETVSGRGIRVGMALQALGDKVFCMGFCSAEGRRIIARMLAEAGVMQDFIEIPGALRMRITIRDEKQGMATRCTQQGTAVNEGAMEQMEVSYARNLTEMGEGDVIALGGDTPPGVGQEAYGTLVSMAKDRNVRTVLAAQGRVLEKGILAGPYAALLTAADLEHMAGKSLLGEAALCAAGRALLQRCGGKFLCVEDKSRILLLSQKETLCAPLQEVWPASETGAAAGLAHAAQYAKKAEQLLRGAVAGSQLLCREEPARLQEFEDRARALPVIAL